MSSFVIACPNTSCAKPLNLPADAVGKPLACPHCAAGIAVKLGPDGTPLPPTLAATARRVPKPFLVPGFALLILGLGGTFGSSYIASDIYLNPGADRKYALLMLNYARDGEQAGKPADKNRGKQEVDPFDPFGAVAGGAGVAAAQEQAILARAESGSGWIGPTMLALAGVGLVMAGGGVAMLLGRWYWLAMAGCVACFLNLNPCFCGPGGVAGVWGLLILVKDDGRKHFGK